MAQATANTTDELISQLASSEIDRLLAESEGNPPAPATPAADPTAASAEVVTEGSERAALLEAAGFESPTPAEPVKPTEPAAPAPPAEEDERAALLQAAGFESVDAPPTNSPAATPAADAQAVQDLDYVPIYLKPLVWINAPLGACPAIVRQMLGNAGIVTLVNALAILTYVCLFRRH
jgi:hypothetical protein